MVRLLKISGFARGEALLRENFDRDPSPCCVILEDDAVLCDRFKERLEALLEELPRDFHFCSLGYSRPPKAPLIEYSSQIGIPSCLWYLTGYIISLDGAEHLLKSLPVVGPGKSNLRFVALESIAVFLFPNILIFSGQLDRHEDVFKLGQYIWTKDRSWKTHKKSGIGANTQNSITDNAFSCLRGHCSTL